MKVELVLEDLERLLRSWKITTSDWILVSQYAYRLLGYPVKLRKGHFNILVNKERIPWEITEGIEIHPPRGSMFRKDFEEFLLRTGFDFDINLASRKEFKAKEGYFVWYKLPNGIKIKIQKPIGAIREFEKLLSLSTKEGFGEERIEKDIFYIKDMIRVLRKKGEKKTLQFFKNLLKRYEKAKSRLKKSTSISNSKKVFGIVANKGRVKGYAVVVKNLNKKKFKLRGSILITKMTSPSILLHFPKISAIVTDQGGMLSHAAILARELNIPCIVGTRFATNLFRSGDFIEVDANRGFVRKI